MSNSLRTTERLCEVKKSLILINLETNSLLSGYKNSAQRRRPELSALDMHQSRLYRPVSFPSPGAGRFCSNIKGDLLLLFVRERGFALNPWCRLRLYTKRKIMCKLFAWSKMYTIRSAGQTKRREVLIPVGLDVHKEGFVVSPHKKYHLAWLP